MENEPKPKGIDRRSLLRGGLAAAVAAAVEATTPHAANAQAEKKQKVFGWSRESFATGDFGRIIGPKYEKKRRELEVYQRNLRDPEKRKIQRDPSRADQAFRDAIVADPGAHFEMLTIEAKKEIRDFYNRSSVVLSRHKDEKHIRISTYGSLKDGSKEFAEASTRNGTHMTVQGTLVRQGAEYCIVTNLHAIQQLNSHKPDLARIEALIKTSDVDIAAYKMTLAELQKAGVNPADAIDLNVPLPPDFQLIGAPVFCRGFDSDTLNGAALHARGFKEWFGVVNKMEAGIWEMLKRVPREESIARWLFKKGYTFRIPAGEATVLEGLYAAYPKHKTRLAAAMSGSPVTSFVHGVLRAVGFLFLVYELETDGREYSQGSFHALQDVVTALKDPNHIFQFEGPKGLPPSTSARAG